MRPNRDICEHVWFLPFLGAISFLLLSLTYIPIIIDLFIPGDGKPQISFEQRVGAKPATRKSKLYS